MSSLNEALQQVPWAQFSHAYGSATDTPSHLLALLSDEPEEREEALQAVLRCRPLWQFKHNLLEIYGLPTSQEELAYLL
jgi:hypothetical protein